MSPNRPLPLANGPEGAPAHGQTVAPAPAPAPQARPTQHIVFDLETLGEGADAVIATIGAVRIVRAADGPWILADTFYERISLDQPGRRFTGDVVAWWLSLGASPAAREIFEGQARNLIDFGKAVQRPPLEEVLDLFESWLTSMPPYHNMPIEGLWCKGAEFDIAILRDVYGGAAKMPWPYNAGRDVRTAEIATGVKTAKSDHHALHDAQAEAQVVLAFLNRFCP